MSTAELQTLKEERAELQSTLNELQVGSGAGTAGSQVDTGLIKSQIANLDRAMEERAVRSIKGTMKDNLIKEEEKLEEEIAIGMPTRYEMQFPVRNPGAVKKHLAWSKRNQAAIERYVEIQRMLRPDEPKSIENLRKEK